MVFLIGATLAGWDMLLHRPWMAWPIAILLNTIFVGFLLFYGVRACKKLGYWPLARLQSARYVASRFFESFLILILINISIGLLLLSVRALFDIEATQPVLIRFATYAPNSWGVVGFLVAAFTLGPVIEEMFFRGFLYNALKTKTSMATACMVQAAVFALCHQNGLLGNVAIFLYGAALAVVYEKKGNLLSPCLIHCIGNALIAVPLLIATLGNLHPVAETFTEAADAPHWLASSPPEYVERKATGSDQVEYAIDTWGSRGAKQWKREADAFGAVPVWFPDDRASSARAKLGLVAIYAGYLQDYRRAILAAKELRRLYPDQTEQCASSLSHEGWSYYMLRDFADSREAFTEVVERYSEHSEAVQSAEEGLKWLQTVDPE